jgi:uncharacterized protein YjdB
MITRTSGRRLATVLVALGVASCFLPSEPSERVTFELTFPTPLRVQLGLTKSPLIRVLVGERTLSHAVYRLEVEDRNIVRVDPTGQALVGMRRGQSVVRVVYTGSTGTVDTTFSAHVVVSNVSVFPSNVTLRRIGETVQMTARADSWDSTTTGLNVPQNEFTWSSENPAIAVVSTAGLVTAVDDGDIRISAKLDDIEGQAYVGVLQAASAVQIQPQQDTLRSLRSTRRFFALALDSLGAILSGAKPHWTSLDPAVAEVDPTTGVATAMHAGTARIVARVGLAADTARLVVKQVVLLLFLRPGLDTLTAIQDTGRVLVAATDSALQDIPDVVIDSWTSSDPAIASVDPAGLVTAHANGIVLVTARSGTESAFMTVVVRQQVARAEIVEDAITLNSAGATTQLTATAVDKNGFPVPGAGGLEWRSHFALVATVDANGLVTARGNGRTAVTVSLGGLSDGVSVTVTGAPQELIAFESANGIEAMRADGTLRTLLIPNTTSGGGGYCYSYYYYCSINATDPAWSPDGTRLAYTLITYDYGNCYYGCTDVYTAWPDGSDAINLTGGVSYNADPAWSPDGTHIAFVTNPPTGPGIFVMNTDGSALRRVTAGGGSPKWSPDGSKIVFEHNGDIFLVNADGLQLVRLTGPGNENDFHPAWSPDGTQIAFASNRAGHDDIWIMNADGSGPVNLTAALAYPTNPSATHEVTPAWSPDGSRLSFAASHCFQDPSGGGANCESLALYIVNRNGTGLQALNAMGVNPAWHAGGSLSPPASLTPLRAARVRR